MLLGIQPNSLPQFQVEGTSELVHTLPSVKYTESPPNHRKAVENCIAVELQAKALKEKETEKYDRGVKDWSFKPQDLVMNHQKKSGKLEPRWSGPFMIEKFASSYGKSYKIRQIGGQSY